MKFIKVKTVSNEITIINVEMISYISTYPNTGDRTFIHLLENNQPCIMVNVSIEEFINKLKEADLKISDLS